jgi:hypothetical protein
VQQTPCQQQGGARSDALFGSLPWLSYAFGTASTPPGSRAYPLKCLLVRLLLLLWE